MAYQIKSDSDKIGDVHDREIFNHEQCGIGHSGLCDLETLKTLNAFTINMDIKVTNIETYNYSNRDPFMIDDPVKIAYLLSS